MCSLIFDLLRVFAVVEHKASAGKGKMQQHIDLVEGKPVFHLALVAVKQDAAVVHIGVHHAAVLPAAVLFDEGNGGVEVADGHQRFDAVLMALIKQVFVVLQAFFVGHSIIAVRQDAGPCDGQAVALEAHLRKEGDILFIMVVHIDGLMAGIIVLPVTFQHFQLTPRHRETVRPKGGHIHRSKTLAAVLPCALALIGGCCAAPQKILRKTAHRIYLPVFFYCIPLSPARR